MPNRYPHWIDNDNYRHLSEEEKIKILKQDLHDQRQSERNTNENAVIGFTIILTLFILLVAVGG